MTNKLELRKSTGITVSLAVAGIVLVAVFTASSWITSVNAQLAENKHDITSLRPEIKELNESLEKTNRNLNNTNLNVVQLQTLIKGLSRDLRETN